MSPTRSMLGIASPVTSAAVPVGCVADGQLGDVPEVWWFRHYPRVGHTRDVLAVRRFREGEALMAGVCPLCAGSGVEPCTRCGGCGAVNGRACPRCGGIGRNTCSTCSGTGRL